MPIRKIAATKKLLFVRDELIAWMDGAELETIEKADGSVIVKPMALDLEAALAAERRSERLRFQDRPPPAQGSGVVGGGVGSPSGWPRPRLPSGSGNWSLGDGRRSRRSRKEKSTMNDQKVQERTLYAGRFAPASRSSAGGPGSDSTTTTRGASSSGATTTAWPQPLSWRRR